MKRALLSIILMTVGALVGTRDAHPYGLTTGADFLQVAPGARPDAMGQAFSAVADDVNALHYNPAGLGLLRMPEAAYSRYEFVAGIHFDHLAVAVPLGRPGVVGLAYQGFSIDPFNSTRDPSAIPAEASENMLLLGWGRSFGRVQAGAAVKKVRRDLDGWKRGGAGVDLGLRWVPLRRLSAAVGLANLGPAFKPARGSLYPATWRAGSAFRVLEDERHQADAAFDTTFNQVTREFRWGGGGEYWYRGFCALRAGWAFDSLDSQQEGFSFGAGLRFRGYGLDYSIHPFASLGMTHRFSGNIRWEGAWVPDVEPPVPMFFKVYATDSAGPTVLGAEVRAEWKTPRDFAGEVEIVRVNLADGTQETLGPFTRPPVFLQDSAPGVFYKVYARTLGGGGCRSLPSNECFYSVAVRPAVEEEKVEIPETPTETPVPAASPAPVKAAKKKAEPPVPTPQVILGQWDPMGLGIQWKPLSGIDVEGYQIYRKTPEGLTERLNRKSLQGTKVWLPKEKGNTGTLLLVTALRPDGTEHIVGVHACEAPDEWPSARPLPTAIPVKVTRAEGGGSALEWESSPKAARYLVLAADPKDRIFQLLGETKDASPESVMEWLKDAGDSLVVLVAEDKKGVWVFRTQETEWKP